MKSAKNQPQCAKSETAYRKFALSALCALGLMATMAKELPAHAGETRSATVSLADLDPSTPQGLQAARDRLERTARKLCSRVVNPWALSHHPDYVRCVDETMANALDQIKGPISVANAKSHGDRSER